MYNWRMMTKEQREELLKLRKTQNLPWHSPPHRDGGSRKFHITASCFEHQSFIGLSPKRMQIFETVLYNTILASGNLLVAWSVLPNHYHLLVKSGDILGLLKNLGKLHGKTSFEWNGEESLRGRKVWCNSMETAIKSDKHYFSTVNYIHNNPVHHGYVGKWDEWPFGNAKDYLDSFGKNKALEIWRKYPISGYGKDWDPPEM